MYIWGGIFFYINRQSQKKSKKGVKKERMKKQTCEHFDPTEQSIKDCYIHTHMHTYIQTLIQARTPLTL